MAATIAVLPCLAAITVQETVHVTAFSAYDRQLPAVLRKGGKGWGNAGWGEPSDASSTLGLGVWSLGLCSVDCSCTCIQHESINQSINHICCLHDSSGESIDNHWEKQYTLSTKCSRRSTIAHQRNRWCDAVMNMPVRTWSCAWLDCMASLLCMDCTTQQSTEQPGRTTCCL